MKPNIKIKRIVLYVTVLVAFVVSFSVDAVNPNDSIPLSNSWTQTNWTGNNSYFSLSSSNDKVFARTWDSFNGGRMFLTTNDGTNWTQIRSTDNNSDILSIVQLDSKMLAGTWNGLYQSTDDGTTWNAFTPTGMPADIAIWSIVMINTKLYAGTEGAIYTSADNGTTWTSISSGITANARITSIVASGDNLFAGSASNGVFKLTNNGTSWTSINTNLTDTHISQLVVLDTMLLAVTQTGVFIFDTSGTSWAADASGLKKVNGLVAANDQVFAGTDGNGSYFLDDNGVTWNTFNMGMPANTRIWSLAINNDGIFAGTSSGIWFISSSNEVNGVREISAPLTLRLEQNYPNPFTTSTTIPFYVPSSSFVSLKIYDLQGREVATIISEELPAGNYNRNWDAATVSSGIYLYRLQAGSYSESKKLILVK